MRHIAILLHEHFPFETMPYYMGDIADVWRENGFRVSVLHGPGPYVDADLAIMHVNLTVVPDDYMEFIRQYPLTINSRIRDISKRRISANLVCRDDDYNGPVIVKTNRNCRGGSEASLAKKGSLLSKCAQSIRKRMPWSWRSRLTEYPIFDSKDQVPAAVWHNHDLVVERFISECRDNFYCMRIWFFLGDKETNTLCYSNNPVVKQGNVVRFEKVDEVPEQLRQMRRNLNIDYGKLDYAIVDCKVILYDVNWTPTIVGLTREQASSRVRTLADGIRSFLKT